MLNYELKYHFFNNMKRNESPSDLLKFKINQVISFRDFVVVLVRFVSRMLRLWGFTYVEC